MNKITNSVKKYVNQTGVLSSIIVTLCGLVSFSISLIGIEYGNDESFWWYECGNKKYTSFLKAMTMKLIYNEPLRLINETNRMKR